jgi:hypothetical protein
MDTHSQPPPLMPDDEEVVFIPDADRRDVEQALLKLERARQELRKIGQERGGEGEV